MITWRKKDFTVCSGVVGTDGWMPPEALKGENTSYPWDIFALGCIYYYVLTDGSHPFGDSALLLHVYEVMKVCTGEQKLKTFYPDNIKARVQILRIISMILILRGYDCTHYSNYNEMLSIFLRKKCAANLITPNLKLDALPTEGKIRIILELMKAIERLPDEPQWCGEDGHGNRYYLIGDGRLYVEYGAKLCGMLKRASNNMPHQKWKLLAETEKMWNTVSLIMEGFDESEISRKVASMLAVAKEKILSAAQIRTAEQQFYLHMRRIPITTH
ncbi:hypothetical protein PRIPAC_87828 [Pristionchus pacificus]|nr:hypothetical protein PRIPAC_87828 [Pristionchus pacificus]